MAQIRFALTLVYVLFKTYRHGELESVTDSVDSERKSFFFSAPQSGAGQTSGSFKASNTDLLQTQKTAGKGL